VAHPTGASPSYREGVVLGEFRKVSGIGSKEQQKSDTAFVLRSRTLRTIERSR
jgi:hypothetical protein